MEITYGYCHCGCGGSPHIHQKADGRRSYKKNDPAKYLRGHNKKALIGHKTNHSAGYIMIKMPEHPLADCRGYVFEHTLVIEKVLNKPMPLGATVHHVNENKADNMPINLVLCENKGYHNLLHKRMRALKSCGHANWLKCPYCNEYDYPENLHINKFYAYHRICSNKNRKGRRESNKK